MLKTMHYDINMHHVEIHLFSIQIVAPLDPTQLDLNNNKLLSHPHPHPHPHPSTTIAIMQ